MGEGQNLHLQIVEPRGGLRDQDMPGFDLGRCRRRAGHLVAHGLERNWANGTLAPEVLDERGAGARVFDQDRVSSTILGECDNPLLEAGVIEAYTEYIEQIVVVAFDSPGRADRVVVDLLGLGRRVPGLNDFVELDRALIVDSESVPVNQVPFGRDRVLLVLGCEVIAPDRGLDVGERLAIFEPGMELAVAGSDQILSVSNH